MTSAPFQPLANQRADEACTRTVACNTVQRFNFFREQAYLDRDPAFLARTFSRKLRLVSFGHGIPQRKTAPEGAARSGDQVALQGVLVHSAGLVRKVAQRSQRNLKQAIAGVGRRLTKHCSDVLASFAGGHGLLHLDLHCSDHTNIWGPHMPVNGVPITIFTIAAQEAAA